MPREAVPEGVEVLLLANNLLSGTLSASSFASPSLHTLTLSSTRSVPPCHSCRDTGFKSAAVGRLSGTLSDEFATGMWNLSAFLANDLKLSGTLPQQRTLYQIVSNSNHTCDWITNAEECSLAAVSLGMPSSISPCAQKTV